MKEKSNNSASAPLLPPTTAATDDDDDNGEREREMESGIYEFFSSTFCYSCLSSSFFLFFLLLFMFSLFYCPCFSFLSRYYPCVRVVVTVRLLLRYGTYFSPVNDGLCLCVCVCVSFVCGSVNEISMAYTNTDRCYGYG